MDINSSVKHDWGNNLGFFIRDVDHRGGLGPWLAKPAVSSPCDGVTNHSRSQSAFNTFTL
jgi:hypothetical protein